MANKYENVIEEFNKRNCQLTTTKEEYIKILENNKKCSYKLNYIASCGHNHTVFYNVFKSRNTGIICSSCKNKEIGKIKKEKIENNELSKICNIEQEFKFIKEFQELVKCELNSIKAFDGCNVDIIFKPNNIIDNNWVGIQVKTTNSRHLTYSFHINNIYKNCLLLLYCIEDKKIWIIPENIIQNQKKISIGYNKSKYDCYNVNEKDIVNKLKELYNITTKFNFDIINTPTNIYQQREQLFRNYREEIINFIKFDYDEMEATVYDFKIKNLKIQEKVISINKINNECIIQLCKNKGTINKKQNQIQYDIGDNNFYWLNCDNKITFFVIPEKKLIEKGFIGNNKTKKTFKITIKEELHYKSKWLEPFMFNYKTINENINKNRLLNLINETI
jgi:7-cyano-7-deazaguanine synthase in queuosine biosynthesis